MIAKRHQSIQVEDVFDLVITLLIAYWFYGRYTANKVNDNLKPDI